MNENIDYLGTIMKSSILGIGSFSDVWSCEYLESPFAYKQYYNKDYVKFISDRLYRMVDNYNDKDYVFPFKFIYRLPADKYFEGYILDELYKYDGLHKLEKMSYENKIEVLKKTRVLIDNFHKKYNCIHADIAPWNIQYSEYQGDKIKLIDFDTNISLEKKDVGDLERHSIFASNYLENVGVDKDVDIYLFNLCAFSFLNNYDYHDSLLLISKNDFGVFNDFDNAKKILESYKTLECHKSLKKEYVIDYM